MRLLIGEKFFESFIQLPKSTQKKVIDFQKKFKDNPKSSAINLENISTFKDDSLRTARVDKKYRAIIGSVKGKEDYYLLWVDNHDEAMAWAENKTFEWNSVVNSPQIFTVSEVEAEPPAIDEKTDIPVSTEAESVLKELTDEQLIKIGTPEKLLSKVGNIQSISDLEKLEKMLPEDVFEHLFYLLDGVPYEKVLEEVEESGSEAEGDSLAFKRFFVEVDDELLERMFNGELEKWSLFLHPSQRVLVDTDFKGSVKVTGGAGTGKTVAALHRLSYLSKNYGGEKNILFATYTNSLKRNLEKQIKQLNVSSATFRLSTIDSIAHEFAKDFRIIDSNTAITGMGVGYTSNDLWEKVLEDVVSDLDPDFLNAEVTGVIYFHNLTERNQYLRQTRFGRGVPASRKVRMEVWKLYEKYQEHKAENGIIDREELFNKIHDYLAKNPSKKPFDHVILDEVQDCSNVELRFIRSLVGVGPNDLFLVGDPYQSIYSKQINFTQAGINIRGRRSKKLKVNYRTTEEIRRYAVAALEGISYSDFDGEEESLKGYLSLFHGAVPIYQVFDSLNKEIDYIIDLVNELTYEGSPINHSDIVIAARTQNSFKSILSEFHSRNIPYFNLRDAVGNEKGTHFCTFHSLKGLEYKIVFLADINEHNYPFKPFGFENWSKEKKEQHLKSEKSLLYTAMTRAIAQLYLTGTGHKAKFTVQ